MAATAATERATQLAIPGALVSVSTPVSGEPVDDRSLWQRAVLRASLSSAAKLVGLALASHSTPADDGTATCAPGLATLVTETGYSRTHVQRQISTLRTRGWLVAVTRPASGRPARFVLSLPAPVAAVAAAESNPSASATPALRRRDRGRPGAGPVGGRPSAAARRRARITGPALAKALTVGANARPVAAVAITPTTATTPEVANRGDNAVAGAAWQILATLARAMRCGQDDFGDAAVRLAAVLEGGRWSAAALATHLVDFVVGGVMVAGTDPADSLGWRLDRLPVSERDCACRSCRSWQLRPAAPVARPEPAMSPPELAAIEQAGAAGTAQARTRASGAA